MQTAMDYSKASEWIIGEKSFNSRQLGKCEAIMALGNGYLGIRSATEERYLKEKRDFFVAGTFNKFDEEEVTELPNVPDVLGMDFEFNGQIFSLEHGEIKNYYRQLNVKTGELTRDVTWVSPAGDELVLKFERIVSMKDLHVIAQRVSITANGQDISVKLVSGIDGTVSNQGAQHFSEGNKRYYENRYMQTCHTTTQSKLKVVVATGLTYKLDGKEVELKPAISMDRRIINCTYKFLIPAGQTLVLEKVSNVFTSREVENENLTMEELQEKSLAHLKEVLHTGYETLAKESAEEWERLAWAPMPITLESENPLDLLALRFAQYHMYIMTPRHDNRMNIGAKGLTGEGYKGHTFWDTDIFILPFFTFTNPKIARSLEEYRYLSLPGAHKKAEGGNFEGAQFPWESAWIDDGEVTPEWFSVDILTGQPIKVWSGFIELHITADVAYGIWQYYMTTGDQDYMDKYGYEILMDTAKFWASRLEWSEEDGMYHMNDVIGPDEYAEHSDDNAYTNYMAHWNLGIAMKYYEELKADKPELFAKLNEKLGLDAAYETWTAKRPLIYLPQPREEDLLVPLNKKYLTYPAIDLTPYKESGEALAIYKDYSPDQICHMQISKQADVLMLFWLMEDLFSQEVKKANFHYYEARTTHDSSLSLPPHVILANDMKDKELAYKLYQQAIRVDIGENMSSSNGGIHAASIAGIWQATVFGFGGVRMLNGNLRICPLLPEAWSKLDFYMYWKGQKLHVAIDRENVTVTNEGTEEVTLSIYGTEYTLKDSVTVPYNEEA